MTKVDSELDSKNFESNSDSEFSTLIRTFCFFRSPIWSYLWVSGARIRTLDLSIHDEESKADMPLHHRDDKVALVIYNSWVRYIFNKKNLSTIVVTICIVHFW